MTTFRATITRLKRTKPVRFILKWKFLIAFLFGCVTVIWAWFQYANYRTKNESNFTCIAMYLNPKAVISVDSFNNLKFDFKNPWIRRTDTAVLLLYRLIGYDSIKKETISLNGNDFLLSDLKQKMEKDWHPGNYVLRKEVEIVLDYQNAGNTSQFNTTIETFIWRRHQWIKTTDNGADEMYEISSKAINRLTVNTSYPGDWELPKRFYIKNKHRYISAFKKEIAKEEILLLDTEHWSFSIIKQREFNNLTAQDSIYALKRGTYPNY